ncbi:MAG: hypothetical protein TRG1_3339 [Flavobacteriaceae bacterium FS1-H7996/R]|nr:MAG: hypothetical protein TRG1_3339 [Flavobacteriaceae bacterium FS1-H7996/R]
MYHQKESNQKKCTPSIYLGLIPKAEYYMLNFGILYLIKFKNVD